MKIELLSTLFKGTSKLEHVALSVGNRGPAGAFLSKSNPNAKSAAKINYALAVVDDIISGKTNAIESIEGDIVYGEYTHSDTDEATRFMFDLSGNIKTYNSFSRTRVTVAPFVFFALSSHSKMTETKQLFKELVEDVNVTGFFSQDHAYKFCDAFYYEWKEHYPLSMDEEQGMLDDEIVKQMVRTGNAAILESFSDGVKLTVSDVYDAKDLAAEENTATTSGVSNTAKFEACKNGDYVIDHVWDYERQYYIPSKGALENFVPSEQFFTLVDLINAELSEVKKRMDAGEYGVSAIANNYVNTILVGKPGTGKTTLANALGATFGMPVRTVTVSKNAEEDLYQGMTKVSEGGFKFVETPFLDVYKNGGIILLEEFNLSDPAVLMGALGQAVEKPFILYEDGYKEVRRHPLCVIISTMNTGTQGSREPSEAFTSRSADVFMLDDPNAEQFIEILEKNGHTKKNSKKVYSAYSKVISYLTSSSVNAEDVALSITLRHCLAALRQIRIGKSFKEALKNTIVGAIAIKDLQLAQQVYENIIEPMVD